MQPRLFLDPGPENEPGQNWRTNGPSQARLPGPPAPPPDSVNDADAYSIYANVLLRAWTRVSKDTLLLQQETEPWTAEHRCRITRLTTDPEWAAVESDFIRQNTRVQRLKPLLPTDRPYRFISRADIESDDARVALKYPGLWQRRPESIEYAAVSAVGFDWSRTKAVVFVRFRSSEDLVPLELRDGKWVDSAIGSCGGIA